MMSFLCEWDHFLQMGKVEVLPYCSWSIKPQKDPWPWVSYSARGSGEDAQGLLLDPGSYSWLSAGAGTMERATVKVSSTSTFVKSHSQHFQTGVGSFHMCTHMNTNAHTIAICVGFPHLLFHMFFVQYLTGFSTPVSALFFLPTTYTIVWEMHFNSPPLNDSLMRLIFCYINTKVVDFLVHTQCCIHQGQNGWQWCLLFLLKDVTKLLSRQVYLPGKVACYTKCCGWFNSHRPRKSLLEMQILRPHPGPPHQNLCAVIYR